MFGKDYSMFFGHEWEPMWLSGAEQAAWLSQTNSTGSLSVTNAVLDVNEMKTTLAASEHMVWQYWYFVGVVWVSAGLYSLSCPPHSPRLLQWPRSPPFPSWPAGGAAGRTAPVCPAARRSSARTLWRAPGPLLPSAAASSASSPAAWLCRSPHALWGPGSGRRGASPRLQGCSRTLALLPKQLQEIHPASSPAQAVGAELEPLRQTW